MKKLLSHVLLISLLLTSCSSSRVTVASEKDRFVDASIEVGCAMFEDPAFFEDFSLVEQKTIEVFEQYGFDATNEEEMMALEIYQEDVGVIKAVQEGLTECAGDKFGDLMLEDNDSSSVSSFETNQSVKSNSGLSNDNSYINSQGNEVHSPAYSNSVPAGASAICGDGTYSFSQSRRGTCSHHGGVSSWL